MKKKPLLVCTTVVFGILTVAGISRQNTTQLSDVALANIEAMSSGEGGYACPGACLTYKAGGGGGLLCDCSRFLGRCEKWCD